MSQSTTQRELTLRGLALGAVITLLFTAANVYLGLRVGLTFATSIPAAVISMALLARVRTAGILENNIVQTVASAAGTLSSVIFVLPGLVMVGWWHRFPFWPSFGVCAAGGLLGVMFSIPLRRALVVNSDLPYPEGVAAAEVLKVGAASREGAAGSAKGLALLALSAVGSAGFAALTAAGLFVDTLAGYLRIGAAATGLEASLSLALVGAGHLVGLSVGLAMLLGVGITWGVAVPVLTALHPVAGPAAKVAVAAWAHQARFIGAGAIGFAALWTLAALLAPIWQGLVASARSARVGRLAGAGTLPLEERDMPVWIVGAVSVALLLPMGVLLADFVAGSPLAGLATPLVGFGLVFVMVVSLLVSAVCGYMAGLIGSSNSPLSGIGILAVLVASVLLAAFALPVLGADARPALVAFALFATSLVFCAATVSNDNLQDLKTGQLVGATPWRQQAALMVGIVAGAAVIPPILNLLNAAYGFAGPLRDASLTLAPLPAPQATLISGLAHGVLGGDLDWTLLGIGAVLGAALLGLDTLLGRAGRTRIPPLAVGLGMYLPSSVTLPIVVGAVLVTLYDRASDRTVDPASTRRMGVLMASGLIVGESLFNVLLAGLIVVTGSGTPLAVVGPGFAEAAPWIGAAAYVGVLWWLYRRSLRTG